MFATIGRTWNLMKSSLSVLSKDRELILFPIMSAISVLALLGIFAAIGSSTGSLDRIEAMMEDQATAEGATVADVILLVAMAVGSYFLVIFFNAALIAAALQRLRGGDPNVGSGLRAVVPHIHNILGWAIISATVGLLLQLARGRTDNMLGRIALSIVGGIWAYMTFFVVPYLVTQGIGPIQAIKSSAGLFRRTWGEQFTANFGFGLFYLVAGLIAFLPAAAIFAISPFAGIAVGVLAFAIALGAGAATEGIFKAALFEYAAEGKVPDGYAPAVRAACSAPARRDRRW